MKTIKEQQISMLEALVEHTVRLGASYKDIDMHMFTTELLQDYFDRIEALRKKGTSNAKKNKSD